MPRSCAWGWTPSASARTPWPASGIGCRPSSTRPTASSRSRRPPPSGWAPRWPTWSARTRACRPTWPIWSGCCRPQRARAIWRSGVCRWRPMPAGGAEGAVGRLRYRALLTQPGRADRDFTGTLQLVVTTETNGRPGSLTWPQAGDAGARERAKVTSGSSLPARRGQPRTAAGRYHPIGADARARGRSGPGATDGLALSGDAADGRCGRSDPGRRHVRW